MLDLHVPTCDFIIAFYDRVTRYTEITFSLVRQGLLDCEDALCKIRMEIYGLYNQIFKLVLPLRRRFGRFNAQVDASRKVFIKLYRFYCRVNPFIQYPIQFSIDFRLSHECVRADLSIFEHFLIDIDAFDDALDARLSDVMFSVN